MHVRSPPDFRASPATQSGPALVLSAATTTPESIAHGIAALQTTGEAFRVSLLRGVRDDEIALAVLGTGQSPPVTEMERTGRPSLIVLTDDDDTTRLGPDGWPRATRALRWARSVMIHGSGGKPEHYELAVQGTKGGGRLLLIETSSAHVLPWLRAVTRFLPPARVLVIAPPGGEVHPVPVPKEAVQ